MAFSYLYRMTPFCIYQNNNVTGKVHFHTQLEVFWVMEGMVEIHVSNGCFVATAGDVGVIFPNMKHSFHKKGESNTFFALVSPSFVPDYQTVLQDSYPDVPIISGGEVHPAIRFCFDSLLKNEFNNDEKLLKSYISLILGHLIQKMKLVSRPEQRSLLLPDQVVTYVTEHFAEDMSQQSVAHALGIHVSQVSKIFNSVLGISFTRYVNCMRTEKAQELLENPELTMTEILFQSGFNSQRTFNRVFKEIVGISPKDYRKKVMHKK